MFLKMTPRLLLVITCNCKFFSYIGLGAFVQNVLLASPIADSTVSESTPPLSSVRIFTSLVFDDRCKSEFFGGILLFL